MDLNNVEFKNEKRFLSNMYPAKILFDSKLKKDFPHIDFDDLTYPSSEHLYQSLKSTSPEWKQKVLETEKPEKVKSLSRKVTLREDWNDIKLDVMYICIYLKFSQNKDLLEKLKNTKGHIEERNDWKDMFWGTYLGKGENHLGKILMKIRDTL